MNRECSSDNITVREIRESNRALMSVDAEDRCVVGPNPTIPTFGNFSLEMARIHGHLCGDGSAWNSYEKRSLADLRVHKRRNIFRNERIMCFTNFCKDLTRSFASDMKIAFNRKCTRVHSNTELRIRGAKHILEELKIKLPFNSRNWNIPDEILFGKAKIKYAWIGAFFDDEAHVDLKEGIEINSVNRDGLLQVRKLLTDMGIESTFLSLKSCFRIRIRNKSLFGFHKLIVFNHSMKRQKLEKIIKNRKAKHLI